MSTSANVIEYTIYKGKERVGSHRHNLMCKSHWEDVLKYQPLTKYTIQGWGYDEDEGRWEDKPQRLDRFVKWHIKNESAVKIEGGEWWLCGNIVQEQTHPNLPKFASFPDNDTTTVGAVAHSTKAEAFKYCRENPCLNPDRTPKDYL